MSEMKVDVERDMAHPAAKVWAVLANFGDLSWAPGTERVEVLGDGIGMTRRIYMPGMDPIDEVLEALDNEACRLRYSIPRGLPMPLDDYQATVRVLAKLALVKRLRVALGRIGCQFDQRIEQLRHTSASFG